MEDVLYNIKYKIKRKQEGTFTKGDTRSQSQRYRDKYIEKNRAYQSLYDAIKTGKIIKPETCELCGITPPKNIKGSIMGHHEDYKKRLSVLWVCWKCHEGIHAKQKPLTKKG